jgi:hypothetical protein
MAGWGVTSEQQRKTNATTSVGEGVSGDGNGVPWRLQIRIEGTGDVPAFLTA